MFVRNTWYVAGWAQEVGREKLMSRTLLGERVVFYRKQDGTPAALKDLCPHRFVPLHIGKVDGDAIQCGYHGLQFAADGACVKNPHGDGRISRNMKVQSYPVAERDGIVWIWMGDPALADESRIVRFEQLLQKQTYTSVLGYLHIEANYQLVNDNLMDLSHTQYVHPLFMGGGRKDGKRTREESSAGMEGDMLWSKTRGYDAPPIPFAAMHTPLDMVDTWVDTYWHAPSLIHLDIGTHDVGEPNGPHRAETPSLHLLTPETEGSTHYFWAMIRSVKLDDQDLSDQVRAGVHQAFAIEDKPIIEMQQRELGDMDLMARKPVLLQTDAGAVHARAVINRMLEAEATGAAALAPERQPEPAE
jgi:phenylpropionate dioxygenase-like ring-hydroxylating dioxygenase large terminal subunit